MAGTTTHPERQVTGVLVIETMAVLTAMWFHLFESIRINVIMVYLLGTSKVAVPASLIPLLPRYNNSQMMFTVIGIIIIVVQGLLPTTLLLSTLNGFITTYMSLTRHQEPSLDPESRHPKRDRYFQHLEAASTGIKRPSPPPSLSTVPSRASSPREPRFAVSSVRRYPMIVDEVSRPHGDDDAIENLAALNGAPAPVALEFSLSMSSIGSYGALTNPFAGRWETRESLYTNSRANLRSRDNRKTLRSRLAVVTEWCV